MGSQNKIITTSPYRLNYEDDENSSYNNIECKLIKLSIMHVHFSIPNTGSDAPLQPSSKDDTYLLIECKLQWRIARKNQTVCMVKSSLLISREHPDYKTTKSTYY